MIENVDYVFIPSDHDKQSNRWDVRIMTGDYVETVISYGTIKWDGPKEQLSYSYEIISTPVDGLEKKDPDFLENAVTPILADILKNANDRGYLEKKEEQ